MPHTPSWNLLSTCHRRYHFDTDLPSKFGTKKWFEGRLLNSGDASLFHLVSNITTCSNWIGWHNLCSGQAF